VIDRGSEMRGNGARRSWGSASTMSGVVLVISILAFMIIPNQLIAYLSTRVTPTGRDLLVSAWWLLALIACSWLLVRVQDLERQGGI
jgi:hypothetical protein